MTKRLLLLCLSTLSFALSACGFHPQGEAQLAQPLHKMYLETPDPYGYLPRYLKDNLKVSKVTLTATPAEATTILDIQRDDATQELLSVSGTQQTRQYNLKVTVVFEITDPKGRVIVGPQTLSGTRTITIQSNQILGSSNESTLFYQQIRRELANAIISRIASNEVTKMVNDGFPTQPASKKP